MATIITVHGTFSSGPLEGQKWWQRGSAFTSRLPELIQGADGRLDIEPFVWNGLNSETARRAAGERLAARFAEFEAAGERYAVVGHSHGGSVLSSALLTAARNQQPLPLMQRWITVGTPFIKMEQQRFLFLRLGILGRAIYLTLLTFLILGVLISFGGSFDQSLESWTMLVAVFLGPMALFYGLLRYQESRRSIGTNRRQIAFAEEHFAKRWLSLWHGKDEAVQCLKAVKAVDVSIFPRHFAASALNLLAVGAVPLACIVALYSPSFVNAIATHLGTIMDPGDVADIFPSQGTNIFENAAVLFLGLVLVPANLVIPMDELNEAPAIAQVIVALFGILLLVAAAFVVTLIFNVIAKLISHGLSLVLNPLTLAQLKAATYGSDARGQFATDAGEWPVWISRGFPPLPASIADGLEASSDRAIGTAIPKFRNIVDSLTAAETADATSNVIADYLTWNELIHTSYFEQESFVKLVAYALCYSDAFRPTEAFVADPAAYEIHAAYTAIAESASVTA